MKKLQVCVMHRHGPGESCGAKGGRDALEKLQRLAIDSGVDCMVVEPINCLLLCQKGPNARLLPAGKVWHQLDEEKYSEIVQFISREC